MALIGREGLLAEALTVHRVDELPFRPRLPHAESEFLRVLRVDDVYPRIIDIAHLHMDPKRYVPTSPPVSWHVYADVLWDSLEYLFSLVSLPGETRPFDKKAGQAAFRKQLNPDLALFDPPMELTVSGQLVEKAPDELGPLLDDPIPEDLPAPLKDPLDHAIAQYRRRGSSVGEKRSALKHLADVLEPLRKEIDEHILPKDESDLFQIANRFYIRHNDRDQKRTYDTDVWLDWMFYVYVATARALVSVLDKQTLTESVYGPEPDDNDGIPF